MARNVTTVLSPAEIAVVDKYLPRLVEGAEVSLTYVKRDGSESSATGTVIGIGGEPNMSNVHVKVDTDRGPRTINVWGIVSMG